MAIKHPAKGTVLTQQKAWEQDSNETVLTGLVRGCEVILDIAVAAMDCQLRVFKRFKTAPTGIHNILAPKKGNAQDWLLPLLRAMTFSNEPGRISSGAIIIQLKDADDLKRWRVCHERMAVILTSTGSLLWPLVEQLETQEQVIKSGGPLPEKPMPTIPISMTRAVLQVPYAVDIGLPDVEILPKLSSFQQDSLRSAMGRVLNEKIAQAVYSDWETVVASPVFYRKLGFEAWRKILLKHLLAVWFPGKNTEDLFKSVTQRQEEERQKREKILNLAVCFLVNTESYQDQIVSRPSSKEAARKALSSEAVAFWYQPEKGSDKGKRLLAFSQDSLNRLLQPVNFQEEYYDAFIRLCANEGILDKPSRSINLGGETFTAVTFWIDKDCQ